jgi:acetyltransferase-like isoleucine patch superfamily enzyme
VAVNIAPFYRRRLWFPWLWPQKIIQKFWKHCAPIQPAIWLANVFFQRGLGINSDIPWQVHFTSTVGGRIKIGKNVWKSFAVSGGCYIQGGNGIEIGDDTRFAPGVKIISANHSLRNLSQYVASPPVRIGKNCWIAANAVILPGVKLGDNVVVGAGAVVTKSFPDNSVVVGVPARLIKSDDRGKPRL